MGCDQSMYATTPIYTVSGLCLICKQEKQIRKDYTRLRKRNKRKEGEVNTLDKGGEESEEESDNKESDNKESDNKESESDKNDEDKTNSVNDNKDTTDIKEGVCLNCCNNTEQGITLWDKNYNVLYAFYRKKALEIKYKMNQHKYPHFRCSMCDMYYNKIYNLTFPKYVLFRHSQISKVNSTSNFRCIKNAPSICRKCANKNCKYAVRRIRNLHNEW